MAATASDEDDFVPLNEVDPVTGEDRDPSGVEQTGPRYDEPDFGDEGENASGTTSGNKDDLAPWEDESTSNSIPEESPFAKLPSLPVDFAEALEQYKLAIIRHRAMAWAEVSQSDVIRTLDALKLFTMQ